MSNKKTMTEQERVAHNAKMKEVMFQRRMDNMDINELRKMRDWHTELYNRFDNEINKRLGSDYTDGNNGNDDGVKCSPTNQPHTPTHRKNNQ